MNCKDIILLTSVICGGIDTEIYKSIYKGKSDSTIRTTRNRLKNGDSRYKNKKPYFLGGKILSGYSADIPNALARHYVETHYPVTYYIQVQPDIVRTPTNKREIKRIVATSNTIANMQIAGIPWTNEEKGRLTDNLHENVEAGTFVYKQRWEPSNGQGWEPSGNPETAYFSSREMKMGTRKEAMGTRMTGAVITRSGCGTVEHIGLIYNIVDANILINISTEDKFLESIEDKFNIKEKDIDIVLYGTGTEMLDKLLDMEIRSRKNIESMIKEMKQQNKDDYTGDSSISNYIKGRTYYLRNGLEGEVDTLLYTHPEKVKEFKKALINQLKNGKLSDGEGDIDGVRIENGNREHVYMLFPLKMTKIRNIWEDRERCLVYTLSSQRRYFESLYEEHKNITIRSYKDEDVKAWLKNN